VSNVESLERLARGDGASNLALRNAVLELTTLLRFRTEQFERELKRRGREGELEKALRDIQGAAGNPDPAAGCRHILSLAEVALRGEGE